MSSHCRNDPVLSNALRARAVAIATVFALLCSCQREDREYASAPTSNAQPPRQSTLQPGATAANPADPVGQHYQDNAFHIDEGSRLYRAYNCSGCHANGGGGIGPALMDADWRYGGRIDQIHATILEGRPNGMPSFRGKLTDAQAWQLAAYVRAMSGNVRNDAEPSRREGMAATPPLDRLPKQPPHNGDPSAGTVPPP
jgi:cytochrome c oxidase cbb3-type subunit 3